MRKRPVLLFLLLSILFIGVLAAGPSLAASSGAKDFKKAEKLFAKGKYRDAITLFQDLLVRQPEDVSEAALHTRIADSYFMLGDFERALASFRRALLAQTRGERPMTQYWIGFCCFLTGRDDEAVRELLKIPDLYPDSGMLVSTAYYWAGRASERMGRKDLAKDYYRKAGGSGKSTEGRHALKRVEAMQK